MDAPQNYYSASDIISIIQAIGIVVASLLAAYAAMKSKLAADQGAAAAVKATETQGKVSAAQAELEAIKEQNNGHQTKLIEQLEQYHKLVVAMAARMPADEVALAQTAAAGAPGGHGLPELPGGGKHVT